MGEGNGDRNESTRLAPEGGGPLLRTCSVTGKGGVCVCASVTQKHGEEGAAVGPLWGVAPVQWIAWPGFVCAPRLEQVWEEVPD